MNIQSDKPVSLCYVAILLPDRAQSVVEAFEMGLKGVVRCCRYILPREMLKLLLEPTIEQPIMVCTHVS